MDSQSKIGCGFGNGRTKIIDPNAFYGESDSSRNIPVKIEDLTISVKLTTRKKSRTTIATSENESAIVKEQKGATINFIEGSNVNGKKVLTTKFTELTTVFEDETKTLNPETFGITNIDIDFNTSYTPVVKIDFVDIKGSSIFQNENLLVEDNGENKYAVFFEMPYPIFELEVKGYYGQPVTYCLHMLKYTSKFNSQTGNFEMSCEFVGYTYAFLSDMLIGVLKVIPYTKIGEEKFNAYNDERVAQGLEPIIDIPTLRKKIAEISKNISKQALTFEETKEANTFTEAIKLLNELKGYLLGLSDYGIDRGTNTTEFIKFDFLVSENKDFSSERSKLFLDLQNNIIKTITKYNELNVQGLSIDSANFLKDVRTYIPDLTLAELEDPDFNPNVTTLPDNASVDSFKKDLSTFIKFYYGDISIEFKTFDLRNNNKIIENQETLANDSLKAAQKAVANRIKDTVTTTLGFSPTVRAMVEIFTGLIEVFGETLFTVSQSAENNLVRRELLQSVFGSDLKQSDYTTPTQYWPWPEYREKDANNGGAYKDTYLGSNASIKPRTTDVDELVFIEDLLNAFLKANKEENLDELNKEQETTLFIPTNPLDTKVFGVNGNPYGRTDITKLEEANRLLLIRAMTFLGYSNDQDYLSDEEIKTMGGLEARMLFDALMNPTIKTLFKTISADTILTTIGTISGTDRRVVNETTSDKYFYNYVNKEEGALDDFKLLPVGYDINGEDLEIPLQNKPTIRMALDEEKLVEFANSGKLFLTNYGGGKNELGSDSVDNLKLNDGGVYIKVISPKQIIPSSEESLYDTELKTDMVLDIASLASNNFESLNSAGWNTFGGVYGTPDFSKIKFVDGIPEETPSMYIFYKNDFWNGLALTRKKSGNGVSKFDFNNTKILNGKLFSYSKINDVFLESTSKNKLHLNTGENRLLGSSVNTSDVSYPYISHYLDYDYEQAISLFGSSFYYQQIGNSIIPERYVKGLLFLNTLPFNSGYDNKNDPFTKPEIHHLFDVKAGFIHTPRLWLAYVGGLLWWLSEEDPKINSDKIIGGGRGKKDPINWERNYAVNANSINPDKNWKCTPSKNQYLPKSLLNSAEDIDSNSLLLNLPRQAQEEFKTYFFDFIDGSGSTGVSFNQLKEKLEIYEGSLSGFNTLINNLTLTESNNPNSLVSNDGFIDSSIIKDNFINYDNYKIFLPIREYVNAEQDEYRFIFLELNDESEAVKLLKKAFNEELIIANTGYKIWNPKKFQKYRESIVVNKDKMNLFLSSFTTEIQGLLENFTPKSEEEKQLTEVFGSNNKDIIKLTLYRHCKNIYDKWLGGNTDINKLLFQCGDNNKINGDNQGAQTNKIRLIDTFRFLTRSFRDIGDELFINPLPIENQITDFPNTTAYNTITTMLSDNNFQFIALPTFINYRDDKMVESVFKPHDYNEAVTNCGPTFVCVYVGQSSKALDINSGRYPNDGFDMRCDSNSIPDDFKTDLKDKDEPVTVFKVSYSQQNQNFFKDISLDQSEFAETEESLKIIEDISMKGFENKPSYAGQNLYNVYAMRSYSTEIEMLGNAMIQPMMYFQLDNIPMFHGAYMIIRARHNIRPNYMSTWFTGTRIRAIETPVVDISEAYMSLIETLNLSDAGNSSSSRVFVGNYINTYFSTLLNNKPKDNLIVGVELKNNKNLTKVAEQEFTIWKNGQLDEKDALTIIKKYTDKTPGITASDASNNIQPWSAAFTSFIMLAGDSNFMKSTGHHTYVTDAMKGVNGYEVFPLNSGLKIKPEVGCLLCQTREGGYTASHCDVVYKIENNKIFLIGGNVSDSVKVSEITLTDGYITNETNVKNYKLLVLKTNNKYYNNKDLAKEVNLNKDGVSKNIIDNGKRIDSKLIYEQLKKQLGYPDEAIAGIMGNMYQESRFNPTAKNTTGGDYGLVQWYGDRQTPLFEYINDNNLDATSYIDQIKFITHELKGQFKYTGNNLKTNKNVEDSTKIFYVTYEGGSLGMIKFSSAKVDARLKELNVKDNSYTKRVNFANQFSVMIKNKKFSFPTEN
jgi:hypothetical protein